MSDYLTGTLRAGMPTIGELQLRVDSPFMRYRQSENVVDARTGAPYVPRDTFPNPGRAPSMQGVTPGRDPLDRLNGVPLPPSQDFLPKFQSQTPLQPLLSSDARGASVQGAEGAMIPVARRKTRLMQYDPSTQGLTPRL